MLCKTKNVFSWWRKKKNTFVRKITWINQITRITNNKKILTFLTPPSSKFVWSGNHRDSDGEIWRTRCYSPRHLRCGIGGTQKGTRRYNRSQSPSWSQGQLMERPGVYILESLLISPPPLPLIFFPATRRIAFQNLWFSSLQSNKTVYFRF